MLVMKGAVNCVGRMMVEDAVGAADAADAAVAALYGSIRKVALFSV